LPQQTELDQPAVSNHHTPTDPQIAALCGQGDSQIRQLVDGQSARVFIISGPSGVGKDSVIEKLRDVYPDARYVVTATSRGKRPGEIDGVHYLFLNRGEFEQQIEAGDFIEHALVYGNLYGVPKRPILAGLANGQHVIIKVDVEGAATLRRMISNTVSLFLLPETMKALHERLRDRQTEDPDAVMKRFTTASHELQRAHEFDYLVFNEAGKLDEALNNIVAIIEAEQRRVNQPKITIQ
jgi:guanylate kinase